MVDREEAELIGKRVIEARERRRQSIAENQDSWRKTGKNHRRCRERLSITRREISELIGFSKSTLGEYEAGNPIRNREYLELAYKLAIRYIQLQRREIEREL